MFRRKLQSLREQGRLQVQKFVVEEAGGRAGAKMKGLTWLEGDEAWGEKRGQAL